MLVLLLSTYELGRQPFGLASPAAWVRRAGFDVGCVDLSRQGLRDEAVRRASVVALQPLPPLRESCRGCASSSQIGAVCPRSRSTPPCSSLTAAGRSSGTPRRAGGASTSAVRPGDADLSLAARRFARRRSPTCTGRAGEPDAERAASAGLRRRPAARARTSGSAVACGRRLDASPRAGDGAVPERTLILLSRADQRAGCSHIGRDEGVTSNE